MSEGRPRVGACACLVEGLQRSMSLDRVGSARTLMSGYAMVRFSASIPLSSSASAMATAQVRTAGPQQQTRGGLWGLFATFFMEVLGGFEQGSGPPFTLEPSRLSPRGVRTPNFPKIGLQLPLQQ